MLYPRYIFELGYIAAIVVRCFILCVSAGKKGRGLMGTSPTSHLILAKLDEGMPGVSRRIGQRLAEASAFCFNHQQHQPGVELQVQGLTCTSMRVYWEHEITEQIINAWDDHQEATEAGATGIAFLIILELTEFTVIRRARKGTGFDYWLGYKDAEILFQDSARLEISGILRGSANEIRARVNKKKKQTHPTDGTLPAYIVVVEFSKPETHVVQK
jgi:hypothetical protein